MHHWRLATLLLGLFWGIAQAQTGQYSIEGRVTYIASYTLGRWEGHQHQCAG